MSEECSHNCSNCSQSGCSSRTSANDLKFKTNEVNKIKKVIGVISGKGGVGKSIVTSMLAVLAKRKGLKTAILDADITGPSIPKAFGLKEKITGDKTFIFPAITNTNIKVVSLNLLLENETDPVVWRGPIISSTIKQFWADVLWEDIDIMFVDMPPGTGDVALTVFQSLPLDGIVIVTTPQDLVSMIVDKAVKMAKLMNIPILGFVENMSYIKCPNCEEIIYPFGEGNVENIANNNNVSKFAKIPIKPELAKIVDSGKIELFNGEWLDDFISIIE